MIIFPVVCPVFQFELLSNNLSEMLFSILCLTLISGVTKSQEISSNDGDSNCQEIHTYGYGYTQFVRLPQRSFYRNGTFIFEFKVQARSDAHVLLAQTSSPEIGDPVYEVVLGAGRNGFSYIRKFRSGTIDARISTLNILSDKTMRSFWIKIEDGVISFGKKGKEVSVLAWEDPVPLDVRYAAFCTWRGVEAVWNYDCKGAQVLRRNLSKMESLQKALLSAYDPYAIPVTNGHTLTINTNVLIKYVNLDAKKFSMIFQGTFELSWFDRKLQWDPSQFNNIEVFHLNHRKIWLPDFILFNAVGDGSSPMGSSTKVIITNNGQVRWSPSVDLVTRCGLDLSDWPWDEHKCDLKLGLLANRDSLRINVSQSVQQMKAERTGKEWQIVSLLAETVLDRSPWQEWPPAEEPYNEEVENRKTSLVLTVGLKRRTPSFNVLLFMPLFVVFTTYLCSFGLSVMSFERIFLNGACQLLIAVLLLACDMALPAITKKTPYLLVVYSSVLLLISVITGISTLLQLIIQRGHARIPPEIINRFLTSTKLTTVVSLIQEGKYNKLHGDEYNHIIEPSQICPEDYWKALSQLIDTITLIVSSIAFIIILI